MISTSQNLLHIKLNHQRLLLNKKSIKNNINVKNKYYLNKIKTKAALEDPNNDLPQSISSNDPRRKTNRLSLGEYLLSIPNSFDNYFKDRPIRKSMWCLISAGTGYLAGNSASLTFGTLAINDVVAAIVTYAFYEISSYFYWSQKYPTFKLTLLNWFKNGVVFALVADAVKLGG